LRNQIRINSYLYIMTRKSYKILRLLFIIHAVVFAIVMVVWWIKGEYWF